MEPERFDHLTRGLAARGSRRNLLRGLSGLTAAGMAAFGLGHQARFARALQDATSTEEQSVILYEEMGQIAHNHHGGNCADLRAKTAAFLADHAEMVAAHQAEQHAWSHDRKVQHADTYSDRLQAASEALLAALARCEFVKYDASVLPATPVATPVGIAPGITPAWRQAATPVVSPGPSDEQVSEPTVPGSIPRSEVPISPGLGPVCP